MENSESKEILLSIFGIALLILAVAGISYAIFIFSKEGKVNNSIFTGSIQMSFIESKTNTINIQNALPISDSVGKVQKDYFDFSIEAKLAKRSSIFYEIRAKEINVENKIDANKIKFYLEKQSSSIYHEVLRPTNFTIAGKTSLQNREVDLDSMILYQGRIANNSGTSQNIYENYRLRVWVDEKAPIESSAKNFKFKINVYANM